MLRLVAAVLCLSVAYGAITHNHPCHTNGMGFSEDMVISQLADIVDRNKDGIMALGEVVVGFAEVMNTTLPVSEEMILDMNKDSLLALASLFGLSIPEQDFVDSWHARFHDNKEFVHNVFDSFDDNHDGFLTVREVEGILFHIHQVTNDMDGIISRQEFTDYFLWIYQNC